MIDLPHARRLAFGVVLGQAAVTLIAALVAGAAQGHLSAYSALLGGGIGTGASLVLALVAFGRGAMDAQRALRSFYLGEALKLFFVIGLFVVAFRIPKVAPLAMFAAFVATYIVYWMALAGTAWSGARLRGHSPDTVPPTTAGSGHTVRD